MKRGDAGARRLRGGFEGVFAGLLMALVFTGSAFAGGPRWYTGQPFYAVQGGQPVVFFTNQPLYYTDPGPLNANVTHAQADTMVAQAAATWNVPTSSLILAQGGTLAEHVSSANTYFDGTSVVFPDDLKLANYHAIPIGIVYDTDGSVIDTLLGSGASSPSSCRQNGVVESVDGLDPMGTIDHAVLILNGRCVGSTAGQLMQMQYQLMRKFGRILGMGWSQLNDNVFTGLPAPTAIQLQNWPVMHPIDVICGPYTYQCMTQPFTLRIDDLSVLAQLYPVTSANISAGKTLSGAGALLLFGIVQFPTGQGMDSVNMVLRRQISFTNPDAYQTISAVTGNDHQQIFGNPVTGPQVGVGQSSGNSASDHEGWYTMERVPIVGVTGWESLYLSTEPINPLYSGDYAIAPYVGEPKAPSGSPVTTVDGLEAAGRVVRINVTINDAPTTCNPGNDGQEYGPAAPDPSGWWNGLLCADYHTSWTAISVKAGHSWTLETTALDENGIGSAAKAHILMGVWNATDPTGTLPTVNSTTSALNGMVVGMTQLRMDADAAAQTYRVAIADERGDGRPDFAYKARLLYADSISPVQVGPAGGRITITGQGFRNGNTVTVNGAPATVVSWTATQIVATAPNIRAASMSASGFADVAVSDVGTGGTTVIEGALSYGGPGADSITLISAPAQVQTGRPSATAFAVSVLSPDGVTPAAGAVVRFVASGGAAAFAACGAASCTITTDANGLAQTFVTATAAGTITLTATEQSSGTFVQALVTAVTPPDTIALVSAPVQVQTGAASAVPFAVRVLLPDGTPAPGASVRMVSSGASAMLGACGAATCTLTTDTSGLAQTLVTATAAGSLTLTATELSGGAWVQTTVAAVLPPDTITLVSAPAQVQTGTPSASAFAVRVLLGDGVTPAANATVRFTATGASAVFSVCGASSCTLFTNARGLAQTYVTATAPGAMTLTATEQSSGAAVQATVNAVLPPDTITLVSAPSQVQTGIASVTPFAVRVMLGDRLTPAGNATVYFASTGAAVAFAACGAASCSVLTDANGIAQTLVTAMAPGGSTLTATEQSSGASVQAAMTAVVPPVLYVSTSTAPRYLAAGTPASWTFAVAAIRNGIPANAEPITWTATGGLAIGSTSGLTDATGTATVTVATGGLAGGTQATAQGCAWTSVCASAAAFGVDPSQWMVTVIRGAGQSLQAAQTLAPVVLMVTDAGGHPVQSATVAVYQTVDAWEGVCHPTGRCPAAPVLRSSQTTLTTDVTGSVTVTPLEVPGIASVVQIAAVSGTQGFVTLSLMKTP